MSDSIEIGIALLMDARGRLIEDADDDEANVERYSHLAASATQRAQKARDRVAAIDSTIQQLRESE